MVTSSTPQKGLGSGVIADFNATSGVSLGEFAAYTGFMQHGI
jgi:hypothetical protein